MSWCNWMKTALMNDWKISCYLIIAIVYIIYIRNSQCRKIRKKRSFHHNLKQKKIVLSPQFKNKIYDKFSTINFFLLQSMHCITIKKTRSSGSGNYLNGASHRLSQSLMSPVGIDRNKIDEIELTITIQKDACGYGMKVLYYFIIFFLSFLFYCKMEIEIIFTKHAFAITQIK